MTANPLSSHEPLVNSITANDILGKDVIDREGAFLGVTDKLLIDKKSLQVTGISVDKGFLKKGLLIGSNYIKEVTPHAVFLSMSPVFRIRGMLVFDERGKEIGTVSEIGLDRNQNKIKELVVKKGTMQKVEYVFPTKTIETLGTNVMLNIHGEDIKKYLSE